MINFGFESLTWLVSSEMVYSGLTVVTMAPMETTARKETGKRMEFGEKIKTTSDLEMLRLSRAWESLKTWVLSCENVKVCPVSESMSAVVWERDGRFHLRHRPVEEQQELETLKLKVHRFCAISYANV
nr:hypothetical protein Iba_chr01fCG8340 [Ipomoea batatas]